MRFLILNCDYSAFLRHLHARHPGLEERSYADQMRVRADSLFGEADSLSRALRDLGHEAGSVYFNNEAMQRAWAREHGLRASAPRQRWRFALRRGLVPWLRREGDDRWRGEVLAAQIEDFRPDVVLNQDLPGLPACFLRGCRPRVRLLVGQHAATPLPEGGDYGAYDLMLSSFPPTLDFFRSRGVPAELWRLGFDPLVLTRLAEGEKRHDVTFVGSFQPVHAARRELIEFLCGRCPQIGVWSPAAEELPAGSPIRDRRRGEAWGLDMYRVLRDSRITVNHHGSIPPFANNYRLYEATGVGTLLLTDWKENLPEMFEPEREVATYRTPGECAGRIAHYLAHPEEREAVARAGQARTLRDHTFARRIRELLDLLGRRLG